MGIRRPQESRACDGSNGGMKHAESFHDKTDRTSSPDGCWLWLGRYSSSGRPEVRSKATGGDGKTNTKAAFALAWELSGRIVPKGQYLMRTCKNRRCVNPDHLRLVLPGGKLPPDDPEYKRQEERRRLVCKLDEEKRKAIAAIDEAHRQRLLAFDKRTTGGSDHDG